jgi:hypothetical protein
MDTVIEKQQPSTELANDLVHQPIVDLAVGAAAATAVFLSRGKLACLAERYLPSASVVLGESGRAQYGLSTKICDSILSSAPDDLRRLAGDVRTDPKVLSFLGDHFNPDVLDSVVGNSSTPTEVREKLLDSFAKMPASKLGYEAFSQISAMSENPATSPKFLARLADVNGKFMDNGRNVEIVCNISRNLNTPVATLEKLENLKQFNIAASLAENPNTNSRTLATIAKDATEMGKSYSGDLKNLYPDLISNLKNDIARHPNVSLDTLNSLKTREN